MRRLLGGLGALSLLLVSAAALAADPLASGAIEDKGTMLQRARGKQALLLFEDAASGYEDFARHYPADAEAPVALKDALILRIGMGLLDQATKDAELFLRSYGAKLPSESSVVMLGLATAYADRSDFAVAKKILESSMSYIDRAAPLDKRLVAHALLGRCLLSLGDRKKAEAELDQVRALFKDPASAVKTFEGQGADMRRIGLALNAVGEARYFFADQKRLAAEAIAFPNYAGKGDMEDVKKHLNTKVRDWIGKKRPAIEAAEKEYLTIVDIQPAPPPRWVIAAAARVGEMWAHFVSDFRAAPVPKEWMSGGTVPGSKMTYAEVRKAYFEQIDAASAPQRQAAAGAYRTCFNYAVKFQYFDDNVTSCLGWLTRNEKAKFPRIDEIAPRWGFLGMPGLSTEPLPEPR
ncbi:MAG: tetratricopeptide repeat protein [Byssovorax sp.]